ncbi:M24 family metallopeptidase [Candidatus Dependentiae bacterium]|nr:M24 family metallopeptidase [Candidatus Dependentiae bacterium]
MFKDLISLVGDISKLEKSLQERVSSRRKKLIELIGQHHPDKKGIIFLFAPTEYDHAIFTQESSFFYFSEISEPAAVLSFGFYDHTILYQPNFGDLRNKWVQSVDIINESTKILYGIDELKYNGAVLGTYTVDPYFVLADYQHVIQDLIQVVAQGKTIFTLYPQHSRAYAQVKFIIDRLSLFVPNLMQYVVDISPLVAKLRRKKDISEIEKIYQAISITQAAFQAAAHMLRPDCNEAEVQAAIEYIFTENRASTAYPSIVAGGKRATVLHYNLNKEAIRAGDLVLIDAGAKFENYCADITRVFPATGKFSKRQKELYQIVLDTQMHVAEFARPGMWLSGAPDPSMSLQHIAHEYLKKYGYDKYFIHGIGHYLGLDVHDVGSRQDPLNQGDVITIEPGIYIPEEGIGIRIEDNFWILADTESMCMSEEIPKDIDIIEEMVQQNFEH